jgi:hypothetical protein
MFLYVCVVKKMPKATKPKKEKKTTQANAIDLKFGTLYNA